MNNRGFMKTISIIVLLFLVVGLYFYTDETKEVIGMMVADVDIDPDEVVDVAVDIDAALVDGNDSDTVSDVLDLETGEPMDASQSAHLLVGDGSGETEARDILGTLNNPDNEPEDSDDE